jgi:hypothetical protein
MDRHWKLRLATWSSDSVNFLLFPYGAPEVVETASTGGVPSVGGALITNADQGALSSWVQCIKDPTTFTCKPQYQPTTIAKDGSTTTAQTSMGSNIPGNGGFLFPIQPVLQRADGTFVGTLPGSMMAFNASGKQLWSQPGYTPKIAPSGGGVIATSQSGQTVTFDKNGNQSGQIASLGTNSWTGANYRIGSVESFYALLLELENSYSTFDRANASHSDTAVNYFPPLASGPGNAIWNAYQDLVSRLTNSKSCSGAAQLNVFDKLNKDNAFRGDTNHNPINTANFLTYLSNTPHFSDGTQSTWDFKNAFCGSGRPWWTFQSLNCQPPIGSTSIKASFENDPTASAATETPSYPLTVFLRPSGTYGIQLTNNGKNAFNEAMFFHEALHGVTGQGDLNLQAVFGYHSSDSSSVITDYIQSHVLNACPVTGP